MAHVGLAGLNEELERERRAVAGRSPPYERALGLLPRVLDGRAGRLLQAAWEERRFFSPYERPLLLLASLRDAALADGPDHPLFASFGPPADAAQVTSERLAAALDGTREGVFVTLARRTVQTNETSRAVAWLWPAALAGAARGGRELALADLGASAGLNLVADLVPPAWSARDGGPLPLAREVRAVSRLGLDSAPLDATAPGDARWLRACVWPGETEREARLEAALVAFRAARVRPDAPMLVPIAASNVPARLDLLSASARGALVLAYQTVVRDYLEPAERQEYEAGMRDWLASHPVGQALWVELEPAGSGTAAAIVAHVRAPAGAVRRLRLARCDVHPRALEVDRAAEAELRGVLGAEVAAGARA